MKAAVKYDLMVIGGGINGVAVANDAAGRGLNVILCEKDDLASHTSWASTKLIHGGLRYLEQYQFKLVRESLLEREVLLNKAPFMIRPLQFVLPYAAHLRPKWMIRLGLFLYDHLARCRKIATSKQVDLTQSGYGAALKKQFTTGFVYSDCRTSDVRLVLLNAIQARENGATIQLYTKVIAAQRFADHWCVTIENQRNQQQTQVYAKALVNAAGPWVTEILNQQLKLNVKSKVKWVKGSHFTVPKLYEGDYAYILQNKDKRIIFVIPYKNVFSLIGTTDVNYYGDLNKVEITPDEIDYLCDAVNHFFSKAIDKNSINWSYAGVRPLYDDAELLPAQITREYHLDLQAGHLQAPVLSIFGGKLTTHRILAEEVLAKLKSYFPQMETPWTKARALPGAEQQLTQHFNWLPRPMYERLYESYGCRMAHIIQNCSALEDLGQHFGADLYQKEVEYLINNEWVESAHSLLWLRSKLGLFLSAEQTQVLDKFIKNYSRK